MSTEYYKIGIDKVMARRNAALGGTTLSIFMSDDEFYAYLAFDMVGVNTHTCEIVMLDNEQYGYPDWPSASAWFTDMLEKGYIVKFVNNI